MTEPPEAGPPYAGGPYLPYGPPPPTEPPVGDAVYAPLPYPPPGYPGSAGYPAPPGYPGYPPQPAYAPVYGQPPAGYPYGYGPAGHAGYPGYPVYPVYPVPPRSAGARIADPAIGWVLLAGSVIVIISAFLDWATVFGVGIQGTDGDGDGNATFFLGLVAAAMAVVICARQGRLWASIVACVASSLTCIIGLVDLVDVAKVANDVGLTGSAINTGPGLWLTAVFGVVSLAASVAGIARRAPKP